MAEEYVAREESRLADENLLGTAPTKKRTKKRIQLAVERLKLQFVTEQVQLAAREGETCSATTLLLMQHC